MIRKIVLTLTAISALLAVYMVGIAPRWLRVTRLQIALPGLARNWRGVRIAHLSDFHVGAPGMSLGHLHKAREVALKYEPDIIALTGDYYDSGKETPPNGLYETWPAGVPVFAVMGNHDRRGRPGTLERIRAEQKRAGVIVLDNAACEFQLRGEEAWAVGVDDAYTFHADVERAFCQLPDDAVALLFLSHSPVTIQDLPTGRAMLMLSGHTHGGQIRVLPSGRMPLTNWIRKLRGSGPRPEGPVYRGWHWMRGAVLVISDGLGISTLPMRFLTRPHLILIELGRAERDSNLPCDDVNRYVTEVNREALPVRWLS